jgi:hypothetical protein
MGLSLDPHLVHEVRRKELEIAKAKQKTKEGIRVPKQGEREEGKGKWEMLPHLSKIEEIRHDPYHVAKEKVRKSYFFNTP